MKFDVTGLDDKKYVMEIVGIRTKNAKFTDIKLLASTPGGYVVKTKFHESLYIPYSSVDFMTIKLIEKK